MDPKLYLVTLVCTGFRDTFPVYGEMVTATPTTSLLALRADEARKRTERLQAGKTAGPVRHFHIVNVLEITAEEAKQFVPPRPTFAELRRLFGPLFDPVRPDAIVDASREDSPDVRN